MKTTSMAWKSQACSGTFGSFVIHSVNRHRDSRIASSGEHKENWSKGRHHGGSTSRLVVCCPPIEPPRIHWKATSMV